MRRPQSRSPTHTLSPAPQTWLSTPVGSGWDGGAEPHADPPRAPALPPPVTPYGAGKRQVAQGPTRAVASAPQGHVSPSISGGAFLGTQRGVGALAAAGALVCPKPPPWPALCPVCAAGTAAPAGPHVVPPPSPVPGGVSNGESKTAAAQVSRSRRGPSTAPTFAACWWQPLAMLSFHCLLLLLFLSFSHSIAALMSTSVSTCAPSLPHQPRDSAWAIPRREVGARWVPAHQGCRWPHGPVWGCRV